MLKTVVKSAQNALVHYTQPVAVGVSEASKRSRS